MAKAKTAQVRAGDLPGDTLIETDEDLELTEAEIEENASLNNLLADLGDTDDDVKVHVYRADKNDKSWLTSFPLDEMDLEELFITLRDKYNGGRFKIQVRQKGAIRKQKVLDIEPVPEKDDYDAAAAIRELKAERESDSMGSMASMFASMMKANQDQMNHQAESQQRFMETIITAITSNGQQQIDPVASMNGIIESVASLHKLAAPVAPVDPTAMILKGVELVGAIRGDGDGEANIYTVLSKAMGSFGETLQQAMTMPPAPVPALPGQPGTLPGQPAPTPALTDDDAPQLVSHNVQPETPAEEVVPDPALAGFAPYVDYLIAQAVRGGNPDLYAEVTIDSIGAEMAHAWLATEEGISKLTANFPNIVPHMAWFLEVGRAVDDLLREEQNLDEGTGSQQTDGDVSTGHETPVSTIDHSDHTSTDGTAERIGGDQSDADDNVEAGQ